LSEQIAHITYGRTAIGDQKISAADRALLFELIESEIPVFVHQLKERWRPLWREPSPPEPQAPGVLTPATHTTTFCEPIRVVTIFDGT
jgi:hypothetical protein